MKLAKIHHNIVNQHWKAWPLVKNRFVCYMLIICRLLFKVRAKVSKNVNINFKIDIGIVRLFAMVLCLDLYSIMVIRHLLRHSNFIWFIYVANRETALAHAMFSAGITYAVSRACKQGLLKSCTCSRTARPKNLPRDWSWGGLVNEKKRFSFDCCELI